MSYKYMYKPCPHANNLTLLPPDPRLLPLWRPGLLRRPRGNLLLPRHRRQILPRPRLRPRGCRRLRLPRRRRRHRQQGLPHGRGCHPDRREPSLGLHPRRDGLVPVPETL